MMRKSFSVSLVLALALLGAPPSDETFSHTFSIAAYDPESGSYGVAVSTLPMSVGNLVPWAKAGVGAIATQASVNAGFGPRGLKLLEEGKSAKEVLEALLEDDRRKESRQIGIVDSKGNVAAFTGERCMDWAGDKQGEHFTVQGNILVSEKTLTQMKKAFETTEYENGRTIGFAERIMRALEAGRAAGGDRRGHSSAAILVVNARASRNYGKGYDRLIDLRVDSHAHPVMELRRIYNRRFRRRRAQLGDRAIERPRGRDIEELCRLLKEKGFYEGEITRTYTDAVAEAVRAFKKAKGLPDNDVVDRATIEALKNKEEDYQLSAGAASRDITPPLEPWEDANGNHRRGRKEKYTDTNKNGRFDYVWLAGYSPGRAATKVHDPLTAQALALRAGGTEAAIVSLDVIGLLFRDVEEIRQAASKQTGIPEKHIIVCSTHNHSSADTIGIWGAFPGFSGVNADYMATLKKRAVEAIAEAHRKLTPVRVRVAEAKITGLSGDSRKPKVINEVGRALLFEDRSGKAVATLVNYACHPEARGSRNHEITSDYPGYVRAEMKKRTGAPCLFAVGDIGGLIAPRVGRRWEDCERMGRTIAERLSTALDAAPPKAIASLKVASRELSFPMENILFQKAAKAGNFGRQDGYIEEKEGRFTIRSELTAIRLGDIVLVTVPGEIFPELAKEIYKAIEAPHKIMLGLGNDELGYIMPEKAWDPKKYEETMSIGPKTGPILVREARKLLKGF